MYTEEEVLKILYDYKSHFELYRNIQVLPNDFFNWFEKHKKETLYCPDCKQKFSKEELEVMEHCFN